MKLLFILLLGLGFSQTEVSQKVFYLEVESVLDTGIDELFPDYNLDWALINIIDCPTEFCDIYYQNGSNSYHRLDAFSYDRNNNSTFYLTSGTPDLKISFGSGNNGLIFTIGLLVTAPFPEEDTGYIEEGYQFCVQPGANLLSFPCDNPISVNQSLPQGAENFITQIVGQGVAATYNPALGWVGSLDNFSPGSGYWFKSNESLCFEYDCVED